MGIRYTCFTATDYVDAAIRATKILHQAIRERQQMPTIDPTEQIKKTIEHHEAEAKWARESAEKSRTAAAAEDERAGEHEAAAKQWKRILEREQSGTRTVTVKLEADTTGLIEGLRRASEAAQKFRFDEAEKPWEAYVSGKKRCECGETLGDEG